MRVREKGRKVEYDGKYITYPVVAKTAAYTVLPEDCGKLFTNRGDADAITWTLPTLASVESGWHCRFYVEAGFNVTVAAAAGDEDKLVAFNDAAADSIAFSTAAELIGNMIEVIVNDDASKWLSIVHLAAETSTPTIAT